MTIRSTAAIMLAATALIAAPAYAQEDIEPAVPNIDLDDAVFSGDFVTVGVGGAYTPSYQGSDDYVLSVLPVIIGSYGGIDVNPRAGGITVDFVPDNDSGLSFDAGIAARFRGDRASQIEDEVVEQFGELDTAIEVGPSVGVNIDGVLNPFDTVSFGTAVMWDVAGAHEGMVVNPVASYTTPLSRAVIGNLSLSAEWADEDYHDYYFRVDPINNVNVAPNSDALPGFEPDSGGFKSLSATMLVGIDLDGNALNGGWGIVVLGGYTRLVGDAADTPFTSIRGSADQWLGALGITYTFGL
ncbi:MipA/OmpV family protein [Aurantiacibacter gangjinensis]|uniref:Structural protein MipA n=1 Tax=Aurantiacibacter gangjinensis TaxID=502682 RepID=A0A0G9MMJ0_9SPHN|nr:MipA/OmpV family protein [Aurantiacibacter gangjinensis]APE27968.1 MltA-interacting MipA [Aurantiacibacter gangjinensis]KLE31912.1 structural protein MipA [Aurantiacibacter gangjinensis]